MKDVEGFTNLIKEVVCKRPEPPEQIRTFSTGATRNTTVGKLDYEGFYSPQVMQAFARYMDSHRQQADGSIRASDNWQKGIPLDVYMKSMFRHFMDVWRIHRGLDSVSPEDGHKITIEEALCAVLFNVQGYLHEHLSQVRQTDKTE